jgi:uncharacterized protein YeaO (DUF488 family)
MTIGAKRIYDPPSPDDGYRVLVDRLWPRGIKRETMHIDAWLKDVAPSDALRRWFGHDRKKWSAFRRRYASELRRRPNDWWPILKAAKRGPVTLLYGARDQEHNHAVALADYLRTVRLPVRRNVGHRRGDAGSRRRV